MQTLSKLDKESVRFYTDKILKSTVFSNSPRQQRFLEYLVTHSLDGDAERLKGYTIGIEVFDKGDDFDPSIDAIVRVDATRIRNKLREYYEDLGSTDEVHINFRKGSYQLDFSFRIVANRAQPSDQSRIGNFLPDVITDKPSLVV